MDTCVRVLNRFPIEYHNKIRERTNRKCNLLQFILCFFHLNAKCFLIWCLMKKGMQKDDKDRGAWNSNDRPSDLRWNSSSSVFTENPEDCRTSSNQEKQWNAETEDSKVLLTDCNLSTYSDDQSCHCFHDEEQHLPMIANWVSRFLLFTK